MIPAFIEAVKSILSDIEKKGYKEVFSFLRKDEGMRTLTLYYRCQKTKEINSAYIYLESQLDINLESVFFTLIRCPKRGMENTAIIYSCKTSDIQYLDYNLLIEKGVIKSLTRGDKIDYAINARVAVLSEKQTQPEYFDDTIGLLAQLRESKQPDIIR